MLARLAQRFLVITLCMLSQSFQDLYACGGSCKPPICGKSMVFSKTPPTDPVMLTGGGVFMLPVVVYATVTAGCSATSATATISINLDCNPGPNGTGLLVDAPIALGFNELLVPVTLPAGPPRICVVTGTATVTFDDGMVLEDTGDTVVCIVEPSPLGPDVPRLSMSLITSGLNRVHPGDQARIGYEIVNNDPTNSFNGNLRIGIANTTQMPIDLSTPANGEGVFSLADPVGDSFPILFEDGLLPGLCVPLPLDPHLQLPNEIIRPVVLGPGEKEIVYVLARPWGLCASGTCSESTAVLEGQYSDLTPGLACSGTVIAADVATPPQFLWDGSGQVCQAQTGIPASGIGRLTSQLSDGTPVQIDVVIETEEVNGNPVFDGFDYMDPIDPHELRGQFFLQLPIQPTDPLSGVTRISFFGDDQIDVRLLELDQVEGAPTGFFDIGPFVIGVLTLDKAPFDDVPDGRLTFLMQTSMVGFSGTAFQEPEPIELFVDGFESGNVSRWSRSGPEAASGAALDGVQVFYDIRAYVHDLPATFPCPLDVTADLNGDLLITPADLLIFGESFNLPAASPLDRNGDGMVNILDLVDIVDKLGCQESGQAPPS